MASKFFGALLIVAGVFISFAGGCYVVFFGPMYNDAWSGLPYLALGVGLIVLGTKLVRASGKSEP